MKSFLAYQQEIRGLADVAESVKTAEKIAASSVHFLKNRVAQLNAYAAAIAEALARLQRLHSLPDHPLLAAHGSGKPAIVVMTSDKGLVGGLWHAVVSDHLLRDKERYASIIAIGAKGAQYLDEEGVAIERSYVHLDTTNIDDPIRGVMDDIVGGYRDHRYSRVDLLYPRFSSITVQTPSRVAFLPFAFEENHAPAMPHPATPEGFPIIDPSARVLFNRLLTKYAGIVFRNAVMETTLSELSARTVAMEHAAVKTEQQIQHVRLESLKERRRDVTQKQLESFLVHTYR